MLNHFLGREARIASPAWNLAKTLLQTAIFWIGFLVLLPWIFFNLEARLGGSGWQFSSVWAQATGVLLFVLAGTLGISSGITMAIAGRGTPLPLDCARQLVVAGPYRFVRNPMAIAGPIQGVAVGLFLGSPAVIFYAVLGMSLWNVVVRPFEEEDLLKRFGEPYEQYRQAVWCWIPQFPGYRPENEAATPQRNPEEELRLEKKD